MGAAAVVAVMAADFILAKVEGLHEDQEGCLGPVHELVRLEVLVLLHHEPA